MTKTITLAKATSSRGYPIRLQQRGSKFDVIHTDTGITWTYLVKAVSEAAARNVFFLETL